MTALKKIASDYDSILSGRAKATIADLDALLAKGRDLDTRLAQLEKAAPRESELAELRRIGAARNGGVPLLYIVDKTFDTREASESVEDAARRGAITKFTKPQMQCHPDPVKALNAGVTSDRFHHQTED